MDCVDLRVLRASCRPSVECGSRVHRRRHGQRMAVNLSGKWAKISPARELCRRGYAILDRRYRTRYGEIDIIARHGATIVFVEVKARRDDAFGGAGAAVTAWKQRRIVRMASDYPGAPWPAGGTVPFRRGADRLSTGAARASRCTRTRSPPDGARAHGSSP